MKGSMSAVSRIAAYVLIITNVIAMITCVIFFALGLWTIASPSTLATSIATIGSPVLTVLFPKEELNLSLGLGAAFLSMLLFFISFMGFHGASTRSQFSLFMYSVLIILLLMLECALLFYFMTDFVQKGMREQDGQWSHMLRLGFQCCEFNETMNASLAPPWSCCGVNGYPHNCTALDIYKEDCNITISSWWDAYQIAIYSGLVVGHLVLSCCSLMRRCGTAKVGS
ncbi:tetraspanin-9 isoform X1 [Bombyx mori]|uniref:Tetraspanin n=1 Tax=Bombyx mori TaxID=7091 RepID=A0A8R2HUM5_BOMMO|nr:tetraspanin-9 [Bombyx mori]